MAKGKMRIFLILSMIISFSLAAHAAGNNRIFLWSVKGPHGNVFLLGSIRVLKADSYPLDERIERAYQASRRAVFEADMEEMRTPEMQKLLLTNGIYQDSTALKDHVSKETYDIFLKRLKDSKIPVSRFARYKPWLCAVALGSFELSRMGYDPREGIDAWFYSRAGKDRKEMIFLETAQYQIDLLSKTPGDRQEELLLQALKELEVIGKMASGMRSAWRDGDAARMESIADISLAEFPQVKKTLFAERNARWASRIESLLKKDGDTFVIMGAGHLVGEKGVLSLLRRKGYIPVQQ